MDSNDRGIPVNILKFLNKSAYWTLEDRIDLI